MTRFKEMWEAQRALMVKMEDIEHSNQLLECRGIVFDLDHPLCQAKLRRYAWQITEEVSEVLDCTDVPARREEIADVLHFLVELIIVSGIELDGGPFDLLEIAFEKQQFEHATRSLAWGTFINHLGTTIHELKNRPWKVVRRPTDRAKYHKMLQDSLFVYFVSAVKQEYLSLPELYDAYFSKKKVNDQRVEEARTVVADPNRGTIVQGDCSRMIFNETAPIFGVEVAK